MWLKSIYLSSGFAFLIWLLPWVVGVMMHHFLARHWKRGLGWLLLVLVLPSFIAARIFAYSLEGILYTPHTGMLTISIAVLAFQAVHWRITWRRFYDNKKYAPRRAIAFYAYLVCILLSFLGVGIFIKETIYKYRVKSEVLQERTEALETMMSVGYMPYPGAGYPFGEILSRTAGSPDYQSGESMTLIQQFSTTDDSATAIGFFTELSDLNKNQSVSGITINGGRPVFASISRDGTLLELTEWSDGNWLVIITEPFTNDFEYYTSELIQSTGNGGDDS